MRFATILTAFAVLVGPLNVWLARKRKRPGFLLVTFGLPLFFAGIAGALGTVQTSYFVRSMERLGFVGLVDEDGVRVERLEHRVDPGSHELLRVEIVHIAGRELLVDLAEDGKVLLDREEVVVFRPERPDEATEGKRDDEDGDGDGAQQKSKRAMVDDQEKGRAEGRGRV